MSTSAAGMSNTRRAFTNALIIGTVLQLAMVLSGHWNEFIKLNVFAIGGTLISALAGILYARASRDPRGASALKGFIVGGGCALIGIAVSFALGDVPANILLFGTLGSAVAGAIGAAIAGGRAAGAVAVTLVIAFMTYPLQAQTGKQPSATMDSPSGLEMRFRHFSPSLDACEKEFRQPMKLSDMTSQRAVFENSTPYDKALMSTQPRITQFIRRGSNEFIGRSDIIDDKGKPAIVESVYRRK